MKYLPPQSSHRATSPASAYVAQLGLIASAALLQACLAGATRTNPLGPRDAGVDASVGNPEDQPEGEPSRDSPMPPEAVVAKPVTPGITLPGAPALSGEIRYVPGRGSAVIMLPSVAGARDFRVFALSPGVTVQGSEHAERVVGGTLFCAGLVQHNQCDPAAASNAYGPNFRVAPCEADQLTIPVPRTVSQAVQVDGLQGKTTLVVEAIDALCPFPGAFGAAHAAVECVADGQTVREATYQGSNVSWRVCPESVPIRTEAEIREAYGSMIVNGHAPASAPAGGSPWVSIGLPAPSRDPQVLARAVIEVDPLPADALPAGFTASDFFESFTDESDKPRKIDTSDLVPSDFGVQNPTLWQTSKLSLYSYAAESPQWFLYQGTLRSVLPDWAQQIMASNVMMPRRAFALPTADDRYLHVTFEVPANATLRRYFWFYACGAAQAGETIVSGRLAPRAGIVPQPGFMNPLEGYPVSTRGWNCLQLVPRNGSYFPLPGSLYPTRPTARPESDIRVVLNLPSDRPYGGERPDGVVLNVSPSMDGEDPALFGSWPRTWDAQKQITEVMLDDQLTLERRVTFDVYFNRGRVVVFANGRQKLCNDFSAHRLNMAEAAIGVGHVLYHSSAERSDLMREDWLTTAQTQYLNNLSMLDQRSFDNFGVRQGAALPAAFAEGQCYDAAR